MPALFTDLTEAQLATAGGKGGTLARLYRAGYPVPPGFVLLPEAFAGDALRSEAWEQAQALLGALRGQNGRNGFAIRSSALAEDSARASFAGEFETVLGAQSEAEVRRAVEQVRASRRAGRALAYSQAQGLDGEQDMAVVVQQMVAADYAGVLFTADPLTGSRSEMPGNFVQGTGDRLVSGEADPLTFTLQRPSGRYSGPPELRRPARELFRLAERLEAELGAPQDIEWAAAGGRVYLLQARPITTLQGFDPRTGQWNDSLRGDFVWSNGNFGEAVPGVMTPYSWSVFRVFFRVNGMDFLPSVPMAGNIGGRVYFNLSLIVSVTDALRLPRAWMLRAAAEIFGRRPAGMRLPTVPLSFWWAARRLAPLALRRLREVREQKRRVPAFIAGAPALAEELSAAVLACASAGDLLRLWRARLAGALDENFQMLAAGTSDYKNLQRALHGALARLVGEADANALMSGMAEAGSGALPLDSLGPVVGLGRVARGEMSREAFARRFGHRSANEFELSEPRPREDAAWLDRLAAEAARNPVTAEALLERRQAAHRAAWERFAARYPRKAPAMRRRLDRLAEASRTREAARSEVVRVLGVYRDFALRAGELTGAGEDVFLLTLEEVVALLRGERGPLQFIAARRETLARQRALPPYPAFIAGRFEPEQWAADPGRRSDAFDSQAVLAAPAPEGAITGYAGAAGVVEGRVRVLGAPEDGAQLQPGEVLVTTTTNVGWTPLFPRAAAIVTDVGAPLSHAAIVARELGIPAVVGTGDATMRLRTGDWVQVDGGRGVVEAVEH